MRGIDCGDDCNVSSLCIWISSKLCNSRERSVRVVYERRGGGVIVSSLAVCWFLLGVGGWGMYMYGP